MDRCKPLLRPAVNPPLRTATGFLYGKHVEAEVCQFVPSEDSLEGAWAVRAIDASPPRGGCRRGCRAGYLADNLIVVVVGDADGTLHRHCA